MIEYRRFAHKRHKCLYCGYSPLEIWALVYDVINAKTGKKYEKAEPVLVCTNKNGTRGCGTIFDPMEFNLTPRHKDLMFK